MENEATALILCFASIGLCIAFYGLYVLQTCSVPPIPGRLDFICDRISNLTQPMQH